MKSRSPPLLFFWSRRVSQDVPEALPGAGGEPLGQGHPDAVPPGSAGKAPLKTGAENIALFLQIIQRSGWGAAQQLVGRRTG